MNKYSKRALKTTATVGMSLAMVLSAVTPAMAAVAPEVCVTANLSAANDLILAIKTDLKTADKKISNISYDDTTITWTATNAILEGFDTAGKSLKDVLAATTKSSSTGKNVANLLAALADCGNDTTASKDAKTLTGHKDDDARLTLDEKAGAIDTAITFLEDQFAEGADLDGVDLDKDEYDTVLPKYQILVNYYADYKNNIAKDTKDTNQDIYDELFGAMETAVNDYEDSYLGDFVDDYVKALKAEEVITGKTVADLVDKDAAFERSNLSDLEDFIKDVKGDDITALSKLLKYSKVEDDTDVAEYMDRLEEMVEEIKDINVLLKSTNADTKDYKKVAGKVSTLAAAAKDYDDSDDDKLTAYDKAFNAFRGEDADKVKTYVENVVEEFFEIETITRTNGNISLRIKDTGLARYLSTSDKTTVMSTNLETLLLTNLDKANEESVYVALVGATSEAEKLIKAVTTDVEGLTLSSKMTDKDAAKIIAAKKALAELTASGNPYNLTAKELRNVKSNADLIEALYIKLILNGDVTEVPTGWVDKGNGNWDFFDNDGKAVTKWVAAGSNWYYVKGGNMLRNSWVAQDATGAKWYYVDNAGKMVANTTIDGFVIDANGIWTK